MAFLTLNGLTIPTSKGGAETTEIIGGQGRAVDGTLLTDRRAFKRKWEFQTVPLTPADAQAIKGLILGRGHNWQFEIDPDGSGAAPILYDSDGDLYSSKGLAPVATAVATFEGYLAADGDEVKYPLTTAHSSWRYPNKYGTYAIYCPSATTNLVTAVERDCESDPANDFTAVAGGVLANDTTHYWQGAKSLKCTATNTGDGFETSTIGVSTTTAYTGSCYVKYDSGSTAAFDVTIELIGDSSGSINTQAVSIGTTEEWRRIFVTGTTDGADTTVKIRVTATTDPGSMIWYSDGFQLEEKAYMRPWIDGGPTTDVKVQYPIRSLFPGKGGFTIAAWVCRAYDTTTSPVVFWATEQVNATNQILLSWIHASNIIRFATYDNSGNTNAISSGAANDGDWHHVACTYDNSTKLKEMYIDGSSVGSATLTDNIDLSAITVDAYIGEISTGGFDGEMNPIDDLLILPYAADADQISAISGLGAAQPDLPTLKMEGDCLTEDDSVTVVGRVTRETYIGVARSGTWSSANKMISFVLEEV